MAGTIREYAEERGISYLTHFTRLENLKSILEHGLILRNQLGSHSGNVFNDRFRLDGTNAVCTSISFPNYKMFYRLRMEHTNVHWVVVAIHVSALWELPCAFCSANAASSSVTSISLDQRSSLNALKNMFSDFEQKKRSELNIPNNYPTNPQAEVLMLNGVPKKYILGVAVDSSKVEEVLKKRFVGLQVLNTKRYFKPREDYSHWK
ncbi:MAG: DUF4433 domain-containing protein [Burkholderiales bacterium]|nr:DUF4433 domain-containing protein [Burkholderiales bacterium]